MLSNQKQLLNQQLSSLYEVSQNTISHKLYELKQKQICLDSNLSQTSGSLQAICNTNTDLKSKKTLL